MRSKQDPRPTVGVFLASGQEFFPVRSHFEQMTERLSRLTNIARSYKLAPVHWQQGGGDTQGSTLQKQIESSIGLQVFLGSALTGLTISAQPSSCHLRWRFLRTM